MDDREKALTICTVEWWRRNLHKHWPQLHSLIKYLPPNVSGKCTIIVCLLEFLTNEQVWPLCVKASKALTDFVVWMYQKFKDRGLPFLRELSEKLDSLLERSWKGTECLVRGPISS